MPIAYSYIRFSTPEQAEGDSLRRQTQRAAAVAAKRKLTIDTTLTLHDLGISGWKGDNAKTGALGAFLRAIDEGVVQPGSFLLVENIDRLSRQDPWKAQETFKKIIDAGVTVITTSDEQEYSSATIKKNPSLLFVLLGIMIRANEDSTRKSQMIGDSYSEKRTALARGEKPLMGRYPRWLDLTPDGFKIIPARVAVVHRMIADAMKGRGSCRIAQALNQDGERTFGDRDVKSWCPMTILYILRSKTLIGEYHPHRMVNGKKVEAGEPVPNYYPAIISPKEFYALQGILATRAGKRGAIGRRMTNVFGDLLVSGQDGSRMVLVQKLAKGQADPLTILVTSNMMRGLTPRVGFSYDEFEHHLLRWVREIDLRQKTAKPDTTTFLEGQLAEIKMKSAALSKRLAGAGGDFAAGLDLLATLDGQAKAMTAKIEEARGAAAKPTADTAAVGKLLDLLDTATGEARYDLRCRLRLAIGDVIERVTMYNYARTNGVRFCAAIVAYKDGSERGFCIVMGRGRQSQSFEIFSKMRLRNRGDVPDVDGMKEIIDAAAAKVLADPDQWIADQLADAQVIHVA